MTKNSTIVGKGIIMLTITTFFSMFTAHGQTVPKLKFSKPQLLSGIRGQINATYLFSDVTSGVDAYVSIENIVNGAYLVNIDDSTLGYYDAWQPTVGGNGLYGSSYIKWDIKFKDKNGKKYKFSQLDATAIDIDGDNVRVREFIGVNGQSAYSMPTQIPSLLTLSEPKDTDDVNGSDQSNNNLIALGPVVNRTGIDTSSQDVRLNFSVNKSSEFKMYTGAQVDSNGTTGAIATARYHCIYFQNITGSFAILPVTYQSFSAVLNSGKVDLSWTINADIRNAHFEVERSFDQTNFSAVGIILGAQQVNAISSQYSFKDGSAELLNHKTIYYRLKQVDAEGNFTYSAVRMVKINSDEKAYIQISPNPFMDKLNVNFVSQENGKGEIRLINAEGQVVVKKQSGITKGYNNLQLTNLTSQGAGLYIVDLIINGKVITTQKVIRQ